MDKDTADSLNSIHELVEELKTNLPEAIWKTMQNTAHGISSKITCNINHPDEQIAAVSMGVALIVAISLIESCLKAET